MGFEDSLHRSGKEIVDRKLPCPDAWADKNKEDKNTEEYARPIIGKPACEIKMRVRDVSRAPKSEKRATKGQVRWPRDTRHACHSMR